MTYYLNTFSAWFIQVVCAKTACLHMALCKPNSGAVITRAVVLNVFVLADW